MRWLSKIWIFVLVVVVAIVIYLVGRQDDGRHGDSGNPALHNEMTKH